MIGIEKLLNIDLPQLNGISCIGTRVVCLILLELLSIDLPQFKGIRHRPRVVDCVLDFLSFRLPYLRISPSIHEIILSPGKE